MDQRKCECGHTNPVGTVLCEACGKPIEQDEEHHVDNHAFPDMRYEGMARRSQVQKRGVIDKIWNFFSSVKIAIILIIMTLIGAAIGTLLPQQMYIPVPVPTEADVAAFYEQTYGVAGKIYYTLGFHNLYSSWWFITLLVMIGTSLVICSLDRVIPLYKALSKPRVNPHLSFLRGQKLRGEIKQPVDMAVPETLQQAAEVLQKKGYRIYREETSLLAEKARFSRWGPYINHVGLILFLLGVLLRTLPGLYLDDFIWVREGQTVPVPDTSYYVKNVKYTTEYYDESELPPGIELGDNVIAKSFQTDVILYENENAGLPGAEPALKEVKSGSILVNHPFKYEGLQLVQSGKIEMQLGALNFGLVDTQSGDEIGSIKLDLYSPEEVIQVAEGVTVRVLAYYPNFYLDSKGEPATKTNEPINPMFALEIESANDNVKEKLIYVSGSIVNPDKQARYTLSLKIPDFVNISGLMVRMDRMLPLIYFGSVIFLIGVVMGLYWQHRRIWFHFEQNHLYIAGHTNKNWFGLRKEAEHLIQSLQLPVNLELDPVKPKKQQPEQPTATQ